MSAKLKEAALALAAEGVRVMPLGKDKKPHTANGFYDATTNVEVIEAWEWDGMIGAAIPAGEVVIDVDPRNGGSGTLKLFKENERALPPTKTVRTGGGGFHYYYRVPEDKPLRAKLGPGIDVKRAGKGYVVVPPSSGYAWLSRDIVDAPDWLIEELEVPEADPDTDAPSQPKFFPWEDGTTYGLAALEREMGRLTMAQEGDRNNTLNKAAFAMSQLAAGGEISRKRAVMALAEVASRIGLDEEEVKATIQSGWKAGERVPRQARLKAETVNAETLITKTPATAEELDAEREERYWLEWEIDEPPPPFYLNPVIPKNAYVWVYGATEASKSMVFFGFCAEASRLGLKCSVYSLENPPATDRDRLRRLRPNRDNFRITKEPLDANDPRQLQEMVERNKPGGELSWPDGTGTDIILIDTYSHAFNSRSEDGNAKAIEFARRMRHVMLEVGCSVVVIDHTGYAQEDEPRDASAKRQQVDVAVLMKKAGEWRPGQPARFTMKNLKAARFANPFYLTGEIRDVQNDIRGLELAWLGEHPRWDV